jgi:predicted dithiol-disulfide oxidoreductase (DUF899 family)
MPGVPMTETSLPPVVSLNEWQKEIDQLRIREKELTRATDEVTALRKQLPMVRMEKNYQLEGEEGSVTLLDLFDGRKQLIVYHFMFGPDDEAGCPGCSWVTDAMSNPKHLNARDTSMVLISRGPLDKLLAYRERMGWDLPWYSSLKSDFNFDVGASTKEYENHMTSVFLREGNEVFRTYYTDQRGVEHLGSHWTYLDLTPYGRQETWEKTPIGWPEGKDHWVQRHDEY